MSVPLRFDSPTPLEYFATLVADDHELCLIEAAVSLAQDDHPRLDVQSVLEEIDVLAARLRKRVPTDATPLQRLRFLNQYFFGELGFAGNVNDYYDPGNSLVGTVLRTRRGIPVTLALLYVEMAEGIGLTARGISFPGHFLVKVRLPEGAMVVDPFIGHSLSVEQLEERLAPYLRGQAAEGGSDIPVGLFLRDARPREVLARMLHNLKRIYRTTGDWSRLLAVSNRLVTLLPEAWEEWRDRGFAHAEAGHAANARHDLSTYLSHAVDAADRSAVVSRLAALPRSGEGH